jgi:hypothetical protein
VQGYLVDKGRKKEGLFPEVENRKESFSKVPRQFFHIMIENNKKLDLMDEEGIRKFFKSDISTCINDYQHIPPEMKDSVFVQSMVVVMMDGRLIKYIPEEAQNDEQILHSLFRQWISS